MADIFSLEALNARHGDALLLHFGKQSAPHHILIDGGPAGVYATAVKPRLQELVAADPKARLDHVLVTHLDDDHVRGVLDYLHEIDAETAPIACKSFWFNVFDDVKKEIPPELSDLHAVAALPPGAASSTAVLASIAQGVELRKLARRIPVKVNGGKAKSLVAPDKGMVLALSPFLKATLVAPSRPRVLALYKEWKKQVKKGVPPAAITADYVDRSVFNLSSLVVVVDSVGLGTKPKRMVLTGDSRGDDVIDGLTRAGFMKQGALHVDLLKIAHHGSDRNYTPEFFTQVTADHYVISADGRFDNPSATTLEWIAKARGTEKYEVVLTNVANPAFPVLQKNIAEAVAKFPALKKALRARVDADLSVRVDLLDPFTG